MTLLFDIEADGLLDAVTKAHCLVIKNSETGDIYRCNDREDHPGMMDLKDGLLYLEEATHNGITIVAHNGIQYDIPALKKLYPWFNPDMRYVRDTLVVSRLIYTNLGEIDAKLPKHKKPFGKLHGSHSLKAWGIRLGCLKDEYEGGWEEWNQEMEDYCVQDVEVLEKLWLKLQSEKYSEQAIELEHLVADICFRQEQHGFLFDERAAASLYGTLIGKKIEIESKLKEVFRPRYRPDGEPLLIRQSRRAQEELLGIDHKRSSLKSSKGKTFFKSFEFEGGTKYQKVELTHFNPGSRTHIYEWLKVIHGWKPTEFTDNGQPKVDEDVLSKLPYPEAALLCEYLMIQKRIGQLSEGDNAWLKLVKIDGRIHGRVMTNGAVTGRATHSTPNMGQVPSCGASYGHECRSLFGVPKDKLLMGADLSGLELRCLAHFMAEYDEGAYAKVLLEGDIHTANQHAAGLDTRGQAKTFIYAFLYGAGDEKIGTITGVKPEEESFLLRDRKAVESVKQMLRRQNRPVKKDAALTILKGRLLKAQFLSKTPALKQLIDDVQAEAKQGYLVGLDGRHLHIRSTHAALNTLLQSAGALIAKQALVFFDQMVTAKEWSDRVHQVAWVHDEIQVECDADIAEEVGQIAVRSFEEAGRHFNFRVPITGEYKVGRNWAETH